MIIKIRKIIITPITPTTIMPNPIRNHPFTSTLINSIQNNRSTSTNKITIRQLTQSRKRLRRTSINIKKLLLMRQLLITRQINTIKLHKKGILIKTIRDILNIHRIIKTTIKLNPNSTILRTRSPKKRRIHTRSTSTRISTIQPNTSIITRPTINHRSHKNRSNWRIIIRRIHILRISLTIPLLNLYINNTIRPIPMIKTSKLKTQNRMPINTITTTTIKLMMITKRTLNIKMRLNPRTNNLKNQNTKSKTQIRLHSNRSIKLKILIKSTTPILTTPHTFKP